MVEFKTIKLMSSIFTPELSIGDKLALANRFQELSGRIFDGELFSAPIPQDAPPEIPRMVLQSEDNALILQVSLERTNLVFLQNKDFSVTPPTEQDFADLAMKIFVGYKNETRVKIQRLAFVTERVSEIADNNPSQFIAAKFCKEECLSGPFNNTKEFEIHSLKKYDWEDFRVNSWVRTKCGLVRPEELTPVLLVVNDINTLSGKEEPGRSFDDKDIERFFQNITGHLASILTLYDF